MEQVILGAIWLVLGIAGVVIGVWIAPENDPPYREDYHDESQGGHMVVAAVLGPLGLLASILKWFSRAAATAKKEKRRVSEEMERELAKARAEVEELLKTKRRD